MRTWLVPCLCAAVLAAAPGCTIVERLKAAADPGNRVAAPTQDELASQVDWYVEPETLAAASPTRRRVAAAGDPRAAVPKPKRKPELLDPRTLVGLDEARATDLFGAPDDVTPRPPAIVWQYRREGCVLELFFYPDLEARKLRTLAYESGGVKGSRDRVQVDICASRIRWAHVASSG